MSKEEQFANGAKDISFAFLTSVIVEEMASGQSQPYPWPAWPQ